MVELIFIIDDKYIEDVPYVYFKVELHFTCSFENIDKYCLVWFLNFWNSLCQNYKSKYSFKSNMILLKEPERLIILMKMKYLLK